MMDWVTPFQVAGVALVWILQLAFTICYFITIPLHYTAYYALALVAFLLSPFWYMLQAVMAAGFFVANLVMRLKYLYIYLACAAIIGICAGCMLHGTSSFIFVLLGVDSARQAEEERLAASSVDGEEAEEEEEGEDEALRHELTAGAWSGESSSGKLSSPVSRRSPSRAKGEKDPMLDHGELFERQWKLLRSPDKPRRRRRGLLAQTIHEESSESDSF